MGYLGPQSDALDARMVASCPPCTNPCAASGGCLPPRMLQPPSVVAHSYYTGGQNAGTRVLYAVTDGLTFATDSMTALPSANLLDDKWLHIGLSDGVICRFGGGAVNVGASGPNNPNNPHAEIDRIPLATDVASADNPLVARRASSMGVGNQDIGYVIGGYDNVGIAPAAESFLHAVGVFSVLPSTMQTAISVGGDTLYESGEVSNDTLAYLIGGFDVPTALRRSTADVVTLATGVFALSTVTSSILRSDIAAAGNATVGLFISGNVDPVPDFSGLATDVVELITYATDTLSLPGPSHPQFIMNNSATGTASHAYAIGGGISSAVTSLAVKVDYATVTLASVASASLKSGPRSSMEAAGTSYF